MALLGPGESRSAGFRLMKRAPHGIFAANRQPNEGVRTAEPARGEKWQ